MLAEAPARSLANTHSDCRDGASGGEGKDRRCRLCGVLVSKLSPRTCVATVEDGRCWEMLLVLTKGMLIKIWNALQMFYIIFELPAGSVRISWGI